jgi:hypothetical protein
MLMSLFVIIWAQLFFLHIHGKYEHFKKNYGLQMAATTEGDDGSLSVQNMSANKNR